MRIKWPNDIYAGDSIKIGGLIINSSYMDGKFSAVIGNLSSSFVKHTYLIVF